MAAAETVHAPEFEETSSSLFSCSAWLSCADVALSKDPLWRVAGSSAALDADPGFNMAACRSRSKSGAFTVLALVFFVFSGPCAEAFQPSVPTKFQQSLEELDPDFGDELDSAGVSAYLNVLPAEAGRDRNVIKDQRIERSLWTSMWRRSGLGDEHRVPGRPLPTSNVDGPLGGLMCHQGPV